MAAADGAAKSRPTQSAGLTSLSHTNMAAVTSDYVVIRDARPGDVAVIGAVQAEAWRRSYGEIFNPEDLHRLVEHRRNTRWPATFNDPAFADTILLVALRSAGIVGFIHFGPSRSEPNVGQIYSFNVHPDEWGSGAAAALVQETCDTLTQHGYRAIQLWTFQAAGRARRFY